MPEPMAERTPPAREGTCCVRVDDELLRLFVSGSRWRCVARELAEPCDVRARLEYMSRVRPERESRVRLERASRERVERETSAVPLRLRRSSSRLRASSRLMSSSYDIAADYDRTWR